MVQPLGVTTASKLNFYYMVYDDMIQIQIIDPSTLLNEKNILKKLIVNNLYVNNFFISLLKIIIKINEYFTQ